MSLGSDYKAGSYGSRFHISPETIAECREMFATARTPEILLRPPGSYAAYLAACAAEIAGNTGWRKGEAYFNILADVRPDIAESLSGSVLDCYESDDYIPEFIEKVKALW